MFVYFLTPEDKTGIVSQDGVPVLFPTADDAWQFIENIMNSESHPKMMWVKEADNGNS